MNRIFRGILVFSIVAAAAAAQTSPSTPADSSPADSKAAPSKSAQASPRKVDRAAAYYHYTVAHMYVSTTSLGTAAGNALIGGLPFTPAATGAHPGTFADVNGVSLTTGYTQFSCACSSASTNIGIGQFGSGQSFINVTITQLGSTPRFTGVMVYNV